MATKTRIVDELGEKGLMLRGLVNAALEFPTKSGHEVKGYSDCSYSAGEMYPSDE